MGKSAIARPSCRAAQRSSPEERKQRFRSVLSPFFRSSQIRILLAERAIRPMGRKRSRASSRGLRVSCAFFHAEQSDLAQIAMRAARSAYPISDCQLFTHDRELLQQELLAAFFSPSLPAPGASTPSSYRGSDDARVKTGCDAIAATVT